MASTNIASEQATASDPGTLRYSPTTSISSPGVHSTSMGKSIWERPESSPGRRFAHEAQAHQPHQLTLMECWNYNDLQAEPFVTICQSRDDIQGWLDQPPPPNEEGLSPAGGFKIVHMVPTNPGRIQPLKHTFGLICKKFGLLPVESHWPSGLSGAYGMFLTDAGGYVFTCNNGLFVSTTAILIHYEPTTDIIHGYIVTEEPLAREELSFQYLKCKHPVLLPVLMVELSIQKNRQKIELCLQNLRLIEDQTGYGSEKHNPTSDYQTLVRRLGEISSVFLYQQSGLRRKMMRLNFFREKIDYMDRNLPGRCQEKLRKHSVKLQERIEWNISIIEQMLPFSGLQERIQAQQTVLFNLITQADTQLNIRLAKDSREIARDSRKLAAASKQDSSAMKIIAVLTTLFLPGTFIATIFSMPLFNWDAASIGNVAGQRFWIYWAVTGPLTLVTMAIVVSWAVWRGHKNQPVYSNTREIVDMEKDKIDLTGLGSI